MTTPLSLIVGLGNPGQQYDHTRHNIGFDFVDALARQCGAGWKLDGKYQAELCKAHIAGEAVWLMKPLTFMNLSGTSVGRFIQFYKLGLDQVLVAHDELDLPPGVARLKLGGGHGGHNGLRNIIANLGNQKNFYRLRLGIGHPGHAGAVVNYVLGRPSPDDRIRMERAIEASLEQSALIVSGHWQKAMNHLHQFRSD
ncbi:MAG: aminoacyl-tRNA hydrolase [Saccharospirillum sp.]